MQVYPGGTLHNDTSVGYSFTENFFSDMGTYEARNGEPNYLSKIIFAFSLTKEGVTLAFNYFVGFVLYLGDRFGFAGLFGGL